jgi:hypothetical protein
MAEVEKFIASVEVGDSANKLRSASARVGATDARAYVAAANAAARLATKVGLLLVSLLDMTAAHATDHWKKWALQSDFLNDAFTFEADDAQIYNSNAWKVTYSTTNAGVPAKESIYIPMRNPSVDTVGIVAQPGDAEYDDLVTQLLDTGLSSFGTAITAVLSVTANDL